MDDICLGYPQDTVFSKILEHPSYHANFSIHDGLIYFKKHDTLVLCIPQVIMKGHVTNFLFLFILNFLIVWTSNLLSYLI
jgi:hypothetical protein